MELPYLKVANDDIDLYQLGRMQYPLFKMLWDADLVLNYEMIPYATRWAKARRHLLKFFTRNGVKSAMEVSFFETWNFFFDRQTILSILGSKWSHTVYDWGEEKAMIIGHGTNHLMWQSAGKLVDRLEMTNL